MSAHRLLRIDRRIVLPAVLLLVPCSGAAPLAGPQHRRPALVERFDSDPLSGRCHPPFFVEGDARARFTFLPDEPARFPGDRKGTLRVLYDTTVPAARLSMPLGTVLSPDDDFGFGAILTIRSSGYSASPDGFSQIAFGLWNAATTGMNRTGFPADSYDLLEFDYFANVTTFGGPFLTPTAFGGNAGGNAFFNLAFQSAQVALPLDVPLLCDFRYAAATRTLTLSVGRRAQGTRFAPLPDATLSVDLSRLAPGFLVNVAGIAAYFEGAPSLHAVVDYDLLYVGDVPSPFEMGHPSCGEHGAGDGRGDGGEHREAR